MMRRIPFLVLLAVGALTGCRGDTSDQPPIHPIQNMYHQPRFNPQAENPFFTDERIERPPVPGTVSRSGLALNPVFYQGKQANGSFVPRIPLPITLDLLRRGQQRFNIYCAVCHDRTGSGRGLTVPPRYEGTSSFPPLPSYHDERIRMMPDGQIFDTITHGVRTMPSYQAQVPTADRWAIIAYIRALERSQQTSIKDVPSDLIGTLEEKR